MKCAHMHYVVCTGFDIKLQVFYPLIPFRSSAQNLIKQSIFIFKLWVNQFIKNSSSHGPLRSTKNEQRIQNTKSMDYNHFENKIETIIKINEIVNKAFNTKISLQLKQPLYADVKCIIK